MDLPEEAAAYAAADFGAVNQAFVERLVELIGPTDVRHALDLGTGPADIPIRLARLRADIHITAVDGSAAMLCLAQGALRRTGANKHVRLVQADAKALPLAARSFDVVFSNSILHHVSDPDRFWREVRRVCKPGGLVFMRDLARPGTAVEARAVVDRHAGNESLLLQEEFYRSLLSAYTVDEVRRQLAGAGLSSLNIAMSSERHLDVWGPIG